MHGGVLERQGTSLQDGLQVLQAGVTLGGGAALRPMLSQQD
jgi:hypothetical protein